jgi:hypothetical protein
MPVPVDDVVVPVPVPVPVVVLGPPVDDVVALPPVPPPAPPVLPLPLQAAAVTLATTSAAPRKTRLFRMGPKYVDEHAPSSPSEGEIQE